MIADASEVMLHMLGISSQLHMLCCTWAMGTSAEATTKMHMVLMRLQLKSTLVLSKLVLWTYDGLDQVKAKES